MERRLGETGFSFSANKSVYLAVTQMWQMVRDGACRSHSVAQELHKSIEKVKREDDFLTEQHGGNHHSDPLQSNLQEELCVQRCSWVRLGTRITQWCKNCTRLYTKLKEKTEQRGENHYLKTNEEIKRHLSSFHPTLSHWRRYNPPNQFYLGQFLTISFDAFTRNFLMLRTKTSARNLYSSDDVHRKVISMSLKEPTIDTCVISMVCDNKTLKCYITDIEILMWEGQKKSKGARVFCGESKVYKQSDEEKISHWHVQSFTPAYDDAIDK
ncbi:hypothetical protein QYM36_009703 [Artemia franciscana]|uniref:Uncharacterized protein n=1 Tax=Artemia franciscana TaxID=6661 RepID=A0AA88HU58_ARTSF|nr:hypothetical protein QYM36_009703 [Artemia franciscana]